MTSRGKLRLGTRGSDLALTQSSTIADALRASGHDVELAIIKTAGDRTVAVPFAAIGPQGVFVREIEQALLDGSIDLAVHSFKDLPTTSPHELTIAAVPPRHDPADLLLVRSAALARDADTWLPLAAGARVGTASARRRVWLTHFRADLVIEPLRGNVPTRIRKLTEGDYDAIVLAAAGVDRLQARRASHRRCSQGLTVVRLDPRRVRACAGARRARRAVPRRRPLRARRAGRARRFGKQSRGRRRARRACVRRRRLRHRVRRVLPPEATGIELVAMHEHRGHVRSARVRGTDPVRSREISWPDSPPPRHGARPRDDAARAARPAHSAHPQRGGLRRVGRAAARARRASR